ncbi:hypothetical protein [Hwanghaeella sp. LZ110]|uniref:hypothetical protein n=1 Tax=Hwanghaeella sp. LZ110 TaxID=3402810 RepID=UPI003B66E109
MDKKYATVHYRRLRRDPGVFPDMSLAAAIAKAMETKHKNGVRFKSNWQLRVCPVPNNPDNRRFINDFDENDGIVFGNLCLFTPGQLQALLEVENEILGGRDERAPIESVGISEDKAPDGTEYLHGIAYWLIVEDHFFIIQHISIQTKAMEEYFQWLLKDQASVLSDGEFVELQAAFDVSTVGGDLQDVQSIEIGGLVPETISEVDEKIIGKDVEHKTLLTDIKAKFGNALKVIEDVLGPMEAKKIIESMPPDAALEVNVNIGYRAIKRKFEKEFMRNIASAVRNLPDGEVQIRGRDGKIRGNEARLHANMPFNRIRENSMLLDLGDTRYQLLKVYTRFVEDGKIKE